MEIDQIAHAVGEVLVGAPVRDLHPAPWPVGIKEDEQVDCSIAAIFAVIALQLARLGRNWLAYFADELGWALIEAHHWPLRIRNFGVEIKHVLHAGDVLA